MKPLGTSLYFHVSLLWKTALTLEGSWELPASLTINFSFRSSAEYKLHQNRLCLLCSLFYLQHLGQYPVQTRYSNISEASPTGTCSCLSVRQDEQCPAHQMVICSTSHLCCIPDSLQPRTVSSIRAARQLLPITLPNGSSQSHGPPRQAGSSICSSFWQRDASHSVSTLGCTTAFLPGGWSDPSVHTF